MLKIPQINQTTKTVLTVAATGTAVYYGITWYQKQQSKKRDKKYGDNPAYQKAVEIRNAVNPSGISWMIDFDGTNKDSIIETISTLKDKAQWDTMVSIYFEAFNESLIDRLNSEFNAEELKLFNNVLNARLAGKPVSDIIKPPSPGKVTSNWVGKRVKLKQGLSQYSWWANKSDIGVDGKKKLAVMDLQGGKYVPASWTKTWIVSDRTTKTLRINTSTIPGLFNYVSITVEFLQIKIPVDTAAKYTYVWVNASEWQLF